MAPIHAHVTVPPAEASTVHDALLAVYAARAYALAEQAERTDDERLVAARAALTDADAALDVFGWPRGERLEPAELAGTARLVGETLSCAVLDLAGSLTGGLGAYGRGEASLAEVEDLARRLAALIGLFVAHEREHEV